VLSAATSPHCCSPRGIRYAPWSGGRISALKRCAGSGGRTHPVFGFWPVRLREDLRRAQVDEEIRKVDLFTARYRLATVSFPDAPVDPFFNANRPEDFEAASALLLASGRSQTP
jgi:hypothetical protein